MDNTTLARLEETAESVYGSDEDIRIDGSEYDSMREPLTYGDARALRRLVAAIQARKAHEEITPKMNGWFKWSMDRLALAVEVDAALAAITGEGTT